MIYCVAPPIDSARARIDPSVLVIPVCAFEYSLFGNNALASSKMLNALGVAARTSFFNFQHKKQYLLGPIYYLFAMQDFWGRSQASNPTGLQQDCLGLGMAPLHILSCSTVHLFTEQGLSIQYWQGSGSWGEWCLNLRRGVHIICPQIHSASSPDAALQLV
jgi:hypothetical protein